MNSFFRHLIILQGDNDAIIKQLNYVTHHISGDWLTVTDKPIFTHKATSSLLPNQAKSILGREFKHAIFDARTSFNLDALAILTGTLIAGSSLVLILPVEFTHWQDQDSLRWSELAEPLNVLNFITHLQSTISTQENDYPNAICRLIVSSTQNEDHLLKLIIENRWHSNNQLTFNDSEQQFLLAQLHKVAAKIVFIRAKRGRGKSALAGIFARHHTCWVTAPNKNAVTTLMRFAPDNTPFFAPDELITQLPNLATKPDWLIIDEAAMIPLPIVTTLIEGFKQVLLTSTVDGYEGTGQGLLLKLLVKYQQSDSIECFSLAKPIRWVENDPLEFFIDNLMLANSAPIIETDKLTTGISIESINQSQLVQSTELLTEFFGLLKSAHYRTSLTDLRRLLDAPNLALYGALSVNKHIVGALIVVREGGLEPTLIRQILQGYRRPKGNLVAQSLVAHAGETLAAQLRSLRINRIAVNQFLRRQGVGALLLQALIMDAKLNEYDFISVSFAYSEQMQQIWSKWGFTVVHVGTHKEASSGSYAVMAIYPISEAGVELCALMQARLARNWYWLKRIINIDLQVVPDTEQSLNAKDKRELLLFASTLYAYSASFAVLCRLAHWVKIKQPALMMQLPLLLDLVDSQFCESKVVSHFKLTGKNELLVLLRKEIFEFITSEECIDE